MVRNRRAVVFEGQTIDEDLGLGQRKQWRWQANDGSLFEGELRPTL